MYVVRTKNALYHSIEDNYICEDELLRIIDTGNSDLALGDNVVIVDVIGQTTDF